MIQAWLLKTLGAIGLKVAFVAGIALAVLAILFGAKQAGRTAERVEQLERNYAIRRKQSEEAARRPGDDDLIKRLRRGDF